MLRKDTLLSRNSGIETNASRHMCEDTPKTAGRDGVMGRMKSHTVMLNCTRSDCDSSSISMFPLSPQLVDNIGDCRTCCNPSQTSCNASVCSRPIHYGLINTGNSIIYRHISLHSFNGKALQNVKVKPVPLKVCQGDHL